MNSKNNRVNHDFQIAYFLAGSCHTPDGAYSLLRDLREDRMLAIENYRANCLRQDARRLEARAKLRSWRRAKRLEGEADLLQLASDEVLGRRNYKAALAEVAFIDKCIERLAPLRKFASLPDPEAHEAAQREEWKLELIHRAENYLLTTGSIAPDHFATMRLHPGFKSEILPAIDEIRRLMATAKGRDKLAEKLTASKFGFNDLLEFKSDDID